jgi:hypothetical protein
MQKKTQKLILLRYFIRFVCCLLLDFTKIVSYFQLLLFEQEKIQIPIRRQEDYVR